eukprot:TRINITY_DN21742_c0_g1_i2.p1 TRINITY_DN21742_c0_g1~~TRINITY_DN21742_c0_g1_i2.p1  ORF type:complete len:247 (-),score=13.61 TRINITY_DN21742_c0_g1_i2:13-687(-)
MILEQNVCENYFLSLNQTVDAEVLQEPTLWKLVRLEVVAAQTQVLKMGKLHLLYLFGISFSILLNLYCEIIYQFYRGEGQLDAKALEPKEDDGKNDRKHAGRNFSAYLLYEQAPRDDVKMEEYYPQSFFPSVDLLRGVRGVRFHICDTFPHKFPCKLSFLSLIHISEPTRPLYISYAVFCLKKKKKTKGKQTCECDSEKNCCLDERVHEYEDQSTSTRKESVKD